jgi:hypothetical protein
MNTKKNDTNVIKNKKLEVKSSFSKIPQINIITNNVRALNP